MKSVPIQSPPRDWKPAARSVLKDCLHTESDGPFRRLFYRHLVKSGVPQRRILFFSDLHIRTQTAACLPSRLRWQGTKGLREFLLKTVRDCRPDHIFFGGDAMAYLCCLDETLDLFRELHCPGLKIGVTGNWDLIRRWLPFRYLQKRFEEDAGLHLLANDAVCDGSMRVFGFEDIRKGSPVYLPPANNSFECILAHNPDTIPLTLTPDQLQGVDLILCGHTHGGQIRIPLFGALATSSKFWKRFEYGLYENVRSGTRMLITAGLGVTFIRRRIFCPPEVVIIDLVPAAAK